MIKSDPPRPKQGGLGDCSPSLSPPDCHADESQHTMQDSRDIRPTTPHCSSAPGHQAQLGRAVGSGVDGNSDAGGFYMAILYPSLTGVLARPRSARKADCISMSCSHLWFTYKPELQLTSCVCTVPYSLQAPSSNHDLL